MCSCKFYKSKEQTVCARAEMMYGCGVAWPPSMLLERKASIAVVEFPLSSGSIQYGCAGTPMLRIASVYEGDL